METCESFCGLWIQSLNPYYNGRYSWSAQAQATAQEVTPVLILIIMEDTHGVKRPRQA